MHTFFLKLKFDLAEPLASTTFLMMERVCGFHDDRPEEGGGQLINRQLR